jgi:hypothetical protein
VLSHSPSGTVFPPALLLLVEFLESLLQNVNELVQVMLRTAPQQADHGLDPLVLVITENLGNSTLDRRLEREEDPTQEGGIDLDAGGGVPRPLGEVEN